MNIRVTGGRLVDPGQGIDEVRDILIENGLITGLARPGEADGWAEGSHQVLSAEGLVVTPGWIDLHVHLREPGEEYKETVASGTAAAVAGGFTAVAAMPNTKPVNDNRSVTEFILDRAREAGLARVFPVAAMTMGRQGKALCEYGELAEAGVRAVSDDGSWVQNSRMMRRVLEYAKVFGLLAVTHAEDMELAEGGVMHEGAVSGRLGLGGIPSASETVAVFRDVCLARYLGCPLHVAHVSTAGSVDVIRRAKEAGAPVTAETAPHYLHLTDEAVGDFNTSAKMNPPLREQADVDAVRAGLADGTIDAIATDHAPHTVLEKDVPFSEAANGIVGLETALPLGFELVRQGVLPLSRLVAAVTSVPARILGLDLGTLAPGRPADLTVIDPDAAWTVDPQNFRSLGRNTPFAGREVRGRAVMTMVGGRVVYRHTQDHA